jgi:hypothetical protein
MTHCLIKEERTANNTFKKLANQWLINALRFEY